METQTQTCCESCGRDVDATLALCDACSVPGKTALSDRAGRRRVAGSRRLAESIVNEPVRAGAGAPTQRCHSRFYIMTELIAQFSGEGPRKERASHYTGLSYHESLKESKRCANLPVSK